MLGPQSLCCCRITSFKKLMRTRLPSYNQSPSNFMNWNVLFEITILRAPKLCNVYRRAENFRNKLAPFSLAYILILGNTSILSQLPRSPCNNTTFTFIRLQTTTSTIGPMSLTGLQSIAVLEFQICSVPGKAILWSARYWMKKRWIDMVAWKATAGCVRAISFNIMTWLWILFSH